jgi:hypothetical protein
MIYDENRVEPAVVQFIRFVIRQSLWDGLGGPVKHNVHGLELKLSGNIAPQAAIRKQGNQKPKKAKKILKD